MTVLARKPRAFVIMPFAPEFDGVYRDLIVPALVDYDVARADTRLDERGILEKIITGIRDADLIVADITNTNPNVMYELGIAHTMGKPTIMLAQVVASLPFDIRSYPVHEYAGASTSREAIVNHVHELAMSYRCGLVAFANPVADFAPVDAPATPPRFTPALTYSQETFANDVREGLAYMGSFDGLLAAVASRQAECLKAALSKFSGAQLTASAAFDDLGIRAAADCNRAFAQELVRLADDFRDSWDRLARATMWVLSPAVQQMTGSQSTKSYINTSEVIDGQLNDFLGALAELRHVNERFPRHSGNLSHAFDTANAAITKLLNEIMTAKGYVARIRQMASESA